MFFSPADERCGGAGMVPVNSGRSSGAEGGEGEILAARREKHPDWQVQPTAGSFFKNLPPEKPGEHRRAAGKYLELAGAKDLREGGAHVFEKHANIVIAGPGATAADVARVVVAAAKGAFAAPMAPARAAAVVVAVAVAATVVVVVVVATAAIAAVIDPLTPCTRAPSGALGFFQLEGGCRCLRGRPCSRRSNQGLGSRRSSLAATPICQGMTR